MTRRRLDRPALSLFVAASTFFAGAFIIASPLRVARAADGDVTRIAGGPLPYSPPNPVGPIAGDDVWFSVYAEMIVEHDGYLYIRDIEGIHKVDAATGSTQRIVGTGYGTVPASLLPVDGVPAVGVGINWERTLAVGPDGAVYFTANDASGLSNRLYRIDPSTGSLTLVADLTLGYLGYDGLFVDSGNSIWLAGATGPSQFSIRRLDGTTGLISTVFEFDLSAAAGVGTEFLGFTPEGAAYILESTYDTNDPYGLLSSRTLRIDPDGTVQVVDRRTNCDIGIDAGTMISSHHWIDRGVRSVTTYDSVGTTTLCTVDLATGATTERVLTGSIVEFLNQTGSRRVLANALTTLSDGTSYFVDAEVDGTYGVFRWDGPEPANFVTRSGTQLLSEGQPFRFTGINLYDANNTAGCGGQYGSGAAFGDAIDEMGQPQVVRSWFFQSLATATGARDWTAFDHTLAVAQAKGVRIIATLGNQWLDCDGLNGGGGKYKNEAWYAGGYNVDVDPGMIVSYRAWVAEIVARYRDNPTIMAWEILNEPEVRVAQNGACASSAATLLNDFSSDIAALIKATDPNHLVSLGTIGGGQCGSDNANYATLHANPNIDLCSIHDYQHPNDPIAGDQFNGIAKRLEQCRAINKPIFVGEAGMQLPETGSSTAIRATRLTAKMAAEFRAGMVGYVLWNWAKPARVGLTVADDIHDIGPGDPVLAALAATAASWPNDGGDADNDGVSNAIDAGAGWNDNAATSGVITSANGLSAVVLDAPAPDGVTIYVPSVGSVRAMTVSTCGVSVEIDSGTAVTITCGSITAKVATGRVLIRLSSDTYVTVPAGAAAKIDFATDGTFTVGNVVGSGVSVTVEAATTALVAGAAPRSFAAWTFTWLSPFAPNSTRNTAKAGKTITLRWVVFDSNLSPVNSLQRVTLRVVTAAACPRGRVVPDGAPITITLGNGLRYLGLGVYAVAWKTPKSFKGSCKELHLDLGEGLTRNASFRFN